jgi:putative ABC transport system permease protein
MNVLEQIVAVTGMNVRSIPQRLGSSLVVVIGIAGVVGVLVSVMTMAGSLSDTLMDTGRDDRAIVLRNGATSESGSLLPIDAVQTVAAAPGVVRTAKGDPAATGDMIVPVNLTRKEDGSLAPLTVRGVSPQSFAVRPEIRLVAGRMFEPGLREVIVGKLAQDEVGGVELGDKISLRNSRWTVVGVFESGDSHESGMLTDASTLLSAYQRTLVNSVTVLLESPGAFDEFKTALTTNPTLSVSVLREPEYYAQQSKNVSQLMFFVTYVVGAIMAVGAFFGALNTMYTAVGSRSVEIATLRALGFGAAGVVTSVLGEALLLALGGGAIGAAVAWTLFAGNTISLGGQLGSLVTQLRVTPTLLGVGLLWACAVGLLGGLFPAIRAARLPVATALRAT